MRIVFLITQDLESPSGLGRYWPLAKNLCRLGHNVCICALHSNFASLKQKTMELEGVRVEYVAQMHVMKMGAKKTYYSLAGLLVITLRATWALTRAAFREPANIFYIGKPHPMNSLAGLAASRWKHCRLYVDCDDDESQTNHFGGKWQQWIVAFFEKTAPRWADQVTTHTMTNYNRLTRLGISPEKITYLSNGVDPTRFTPAPPEAIQKVRDELGLGSSPAIVFVGSLGLAAHPINLLIEAFAHVHQAQPAARLLLVGGGEDIDVLKKQCAQLGINEAVRFTGRIPPDQVRVYYQLAQVSVDPVYDDPVAKARSPLKMFESWLCGVPFVTSDVGDRRTLAGQPPAALLVEPGSPLHLAQASLAILEDHRLAEQLRQQGYTRVKEYTWDRITDGIAALFTEHA